MCPHHHSKGVKCEQTIRSSSMHPVMHSVIHSSVCSLVKICVVAGAHNVTAGFFR
jgi:hypothetical protein